MKTFKQLIRENTGSSLLDSGAVYGYQYNQPAPDYGIKIELDYRRNEVMTTIETSEFLDATLNQVDKLNDEFSAFIEDKDGSYMDMVDQFAEANGFKIVAEGNTYNEENDLSQSILFHYLLPDSVDDSDWYYKNELIVVVQTHNGCDIRGGYSSPVFCEPSCDSQEFLQFSCGYRVRDSDDHDEFSTGYSRDPSDQLNKAIEKIISHTDSDFTVLLKSGDTITLSSDNYLIDGGLKIIATGQNDDTAK